MTEKQLKSVMDSITMPEAMAQELRKNVSGKKQKKTYIPVSENCCGCDSGGVDPVGRNDLLCRLSGEKSPGIF